MVIGFGKEGRISSRGEEERQEEKGDGFSVLFVLPFSFPPIFSRLNLTVLSLLRGAFTGEVQASTFTTSNRTSSLPRIPPRRAHRHHLLPPRSTRAHRALYCLLQDSPNIFPFGLHRFPIANLRRGCSFRCFEGESADLPTSDISPL